MSRHTEKIERLTNEDLHKAIGMYDAGLQGFFDVKDASECAEIRVWLEREVAARGCKQIVMNHGGPMSARIPTPDEKRAELESANDEQVAALLKRVSFSIGISRRMRVTASIVGVSRNSVETVMKVLSERGWDSKIVSDDRDGDYLNITERQTTEG